MESSGQGEAGLIMISTKETLSVSRIIHQVIPVGKKGELVTSLIRVPSGP